MKLKKNNNLKIKKKMKIKSKTMYIFKITLLSTD